MCGSCSCSLPSLPYSFRLNLLQIDCSRAGQRHIRSSVEALRLSTVIPVSLYLISSASLVSGFYIRSTISFYLPSQYSINFNSSSLPYNIAIMDDEARQALASMKMPRRPINFVPATSGEILKLGQITCRIMEDGSRTGTCPLFNLLFTSPTLLHKTTA